MQSTIFWQFTFIITFQHSVLGCNITPDEWLTELNMELALFYRISSLKMWDYETGDIKDKPNDVWLPSESFAIWKDIKCKTASALTNLTEDQSRMVYLLCRGARYDADLQELNAIFGGILANLYMTTRVCTAGGKCLSIEPDMAKIMRETRNPDILLWTWTAWRKAIGPPALEIYPEFIEVQNAAARNNGYKDIGEVWREELEIPNLEEVVENLYKEIASFHALLHAFVRFQLYNFYGEQHVKLDQPIPAHLLGNMWSHSWESLIDIIFPICKIDFDGKLKNIAHSALELVKLAEEFYVSLGMPQMMNKFWNYSKITNDNSLSSCHGSAANLFGKDDFRIHVCASVCWEDFYVITHEMGHIENFMAYDHLPTIFKASTNSAFQETIGDTIMMAVESPEHLKRLGIVDSISSEVSMALLLRQALKKIPHIAFGLVADKWRWNVMSSKIQKKSYNKMWWKYRWDYEGIKPPVPRTKSDFDAAAKFHIIDHTPYIRYYLSEFLNFQLLDVLCNSNSSAEGIVPGLHNCDLYGSLDAGLKLRNIMEKGGTKVLGKMLEEFSKGKYNTITADPLLQYFSPLIAWLQEQIYKFSIPVGW